MKAEPGIKDNQGRTWRRLIVTDCFISTKAWYSLYKGTLEATRKRVRMCDDERHMWIALQRLTMMKNITADLFTILYLFRGLLFSLSSAPATIVFFLGRF